MDDLMVSIRKTPGGRVVRSEGVHTFTLNTSDIDFGRYNVQIVEVVVCRRLTNVTSWTFRYLFC